MIYVFSMINLIFQSQRDNLHVSAQVSRVFQVRRKKILRFSSVLVICKLDVAI